jgi:hypothetical protein
MGVDINADQVYKPRRDLNSTSLKYVTTKNKNKYGQDYDHNTPDLTEYRSRSTKKRGYDPHKHYSKTEAAQLHNRQDYNKVWDESREVDVEDHY